MTSFDVATTASTPGAAGGVALHPDAGSAPGPSAAHLHGRCRLVFAALLAERVDMVEADRLAPEARPSVAARHKLPQRRLGVGAAPPLRWTMDAASLSIGGLDSEPRVEVALFPTGACALTWTVPFASDAAELIELSAEAYDHVGLAAASRSILAGLAADLAPALHGAIPADEAPSEDYVLFELPPASDPAVRGLIEEAPTLARVLRAERALLSDGEVADAVARPISYAPDEGCWVDWLGAVLVGEDLTDERYVLEAANVELLGLRGLERALMLDLQLAQSEQIGGSAWNPFGSRGAERARIARRQVRDALTHEGVDNALGTLGDDYLARLHRRAAERFHLADWDTSIQRKLGVLDGIHAKLTEAAAHRRSELLEWIIIVLIAVDIALIVAGGGH